MADHKITTRVMKDPGQKGYTFAILDGNTILAESVERYSSSGRAFNAATDLMYLICDSWAPSHLEIRAGLQPAGGSHTPDRNPPPVTEEERMVAGHLLGEALKDPSELP